MIHTPTFEPIIDAETELSLWGKILPADKNEMNQTLKN